MLVRSASKSAKQCELCGETFHRAPRQTHCRWQARRFCGVECRTEHLNTSRWNETGGDDANIMATRELLKSLVRVGLRHGRLYSLPANDVKQLARDLGIRA